MSIFGRKIDTLGNGQGAEHASQTWRRVHDVLDYTQANVERALTGNGLGALIIEVNNAELADRQPVTPGTEAVARTVANANTFSSPVEVQPDAAVHAAHTAAFVTEAAVTPEVAAAVSAVNEAYDVDQQLAAIGYGSAQGEVN